MSRLAQILRQEMDSTGPLPFARFMELALYCPDLGYYERNPAKIGRAGDFYTSASTGRLFAELLGFHFAGWLEQISGRPVQLLEAGAHQGGLALDLLTWLQQDKPALFERLEYWILENSPARRAWQERTLHPFLPKVRWFDSIASVPSSGLCGAMFSNEFLDALPVHRLGWNAAERRWFEWGVGYHQDRFVWQPLTQCSVALDEALLAGELDCPEELAALLPPGFAIEICPAAKQWWASAAQRLRQGFLLTFDYGLRGRDWFSPARPGGTLRAYRQHRVCDDVLAHPGEQDITAHVNFTLLQNSGEGAGLETVLFETQERFLNRVFRQAWDAHAPFLARRSDWKRQFHTLTHPEHLGRAFHVLAQRRPP